MERPRSATPDATVVIPTHDRCGLLALTLRSVLWQREVDLEVVVVDDGSSDDTAAMVAGLGDPRVRLVRHPTALGVSAARNRGIAEARGVWVAFLDDDDLWAPDKLAMQLRAARGSGRAWAYAGAVNVDRELRVVEGGPPLPPERIVELLGHYNPMPVGASNVLVRADALARAGPFDTRLRRSEDWDMWIRLARLEQPAWVCQPLVAYRMHAGSNAFLDADRMLEEAGVIARRYRLPVDRAAQYRRAAWTCLRAGRRREALGYYARAVRIGDVKSVARAMVALLLRPATTDSYPGRRLPRRPDPTSKRWKAEAQAWLDQLARP
jgi:glycosyltransferase involved in cell wall biosynthesis